ncbi:hypothetical protein AYI69_g9855 [Smittium culicis]|uniref:Uncharacterized protein n=1 Tax=Smittium culicis TaxID=133412 RepID=A0A1R1X9T5_9FUNG|nr:hypothetical protein AYI69_g9855 [Smittium culicis]
MIFIGQLGSLGQLESSPLHDHKTKKTKKNRSMGTSTRKSANYEMENFSRNEGLSENHIRDLDTIYKWDILRS